MKTPSLTSLNRATKAPAWVEANPAVMEEVTLDQADMVEETLVAEGRQGWREVTLDLEAMEVTLDLETLGAPEAMEVTLEVMEVTLDLEILGALEAMEVTLDLETLGALEAMEVTLDLETLGVLEAMEVTLEVMEVTQAQAHPEVISHIQCTLPNCTNI